MLNKKAQISETMTWVVATIIIILILTAFVYSSGLFGKAKEVTIDKISKISKKNLIASASALIPEEKTSGYEEELAKWSYSDDKSIFAYNLLKNEESKLYLYKLLKEKQFSEETINNKINSLN
jgi:hypothetical protein